MDSSLRNLFQQQAEDVADVDYQLRSQGCMWEGSISISRRINTSCCMKLFLPPSSVLPSFGILLRGRKPNRTVGRVALFDNTSECEEVTYQLYLPRTRSFYQLKELLPRVLTPCPARVSLSCVPLPTAVSLRLEYDAGRIVLQSDYERMCLSLISFDPITVVHESSSTSTIRTYCSPQLSLSQETLSKQCAVLYETCQRWFGPNPFAELDVYVDWTERYLPEDTVVAWNSGGTIYLLSGGQRGLSHELLLKLAHEVVHEWNGRYTYPATALECWFLEGVTELLAFQLASTTGQIPFDTLVKMFVGRLGIGEHAGPIPQQQIDADAYRQALQFALRLELALRDVGVQVRTVLKELVMMRSQQSFAKADILAIIQSYIDPASLIRRETGVVEDCRLLSEVVRG